MDRTVRARRSVIIFFNSNAPVLTLSIRSIACLFEEVKQQAKVAGTFHVPSAKRREEKCPPQRGRPTLGTFHVQFIFLTSTVELT
jgi:hypothetical protein